MNVTSLETAVAPKSQHRQNH